MAEIRVTDDHEDDTLTRPERLAAGHALPGGPEMTGVAMTDTSHMLPAHASPGVVGQVAATDDPDVARAEIEQTRARMSSTIDTIEEVLLRKKEQIQEKLDVMAPVRENPLPSAAAVFGVGLLLGLLTGGGRHAEPRAVDMDLDELVAGGLAARGASRGWKQRNHSLKARTRSLEQVVREQRRELKRMRAELAAAGVATAGAEGLYYDDEEEHSDGGVSGLSHTVAQGVSSFVSRLFGGGGEEELQVEVELESDPQFRGQVDPYYGDNPERGATDEYGYGFPGGADQVHG